MLHWLQDHRKSVAAFASSAVAVAFAVSWFRCRSGGNYGRARRLDPCNPSHRRWMTSIKAFILDIDGVIHVAHMPVPGAPAALEALKAAGKSVVFMTNNATKSPKEVAQLFQTFGAPCSPDDVLTSGAAAAEYLRSLHMEGQRVYVLGMPPLMNVLQERAGVITFGSDEDNRKTREDMSKDFLPQMMPPASEVAAVVVGTDYDINYYKVARAMNYLRQNPQCRFILTNPDPRAKLGGDAMIPAAGAASQFVAVGAGRQPDMVCGKPSVSLARHILKSRGFDPGSTCMVGDRLDTDIEFGLSAGMQTLFVESGSMVADEAFAAAPQQRPHFVAPSIAVLKDFLVA